MRLWCLPILLSLLLAAGCSEDNTFMRYAKGLRGATVKDNVRNLTNEDPEVRRKAVVALGERRNADVTNILCAVLETDKDPLVRAAAAEALGKIGNPSAIPTLVKALDDERYMVRWDAVKALGELKAGPAIPNLERVAKTDRQSDVRLAAVNALGKIGGKEAIGPLIDVLSDKDENIAYFASQNLARLTGQSFGVQPTKWTQWWEENRDKPLPPPPGATTTTSWWSRWRSGSKAAPEAPAPVKPEVKTEPKPAAPAPAKPETKPAPSPASEQKAAPAKSGNWFTRLFKKKEAAPPEAKKEEPSQPAPATETKKSNQ